MWCFSLVHNPISIPSLCLCKQCHNRREFMLCKWRNVLVPLAYLSPRFLPFKIDWVYLNHRLCSQEAGKAPWHAGYFEKRKSLSLFFSLVGNRFQSQPVQHRKLRGKPVVNLEISPSTFWCLIEQSQKQTHKGSFLESFIKHHLLHACGWTVFPRDHKNQIFLKVVTRRQLQASNSEGSWLTLLAWSLLSSFSWI